MACLYFLGKNKRLGALDHKFRRNHEYNATVLKANTNLGCNNKKETFLQQENLWFQGFCPTQATFGLLYS
jgi:hypothetical protein